MLGVTLHCFRESASGDFSAPDALPASTPHLPASRVNGWNFPQIVRAVLPLGGFGLDAAVAALRSIVASQRTTPPTCENCLGPEPMKPFGHLLSGAHP